MDSEKSLIKGRRNSHNGNLALWTGAWVLSMALASFGPLLWNDNNSLSVIAILLNVGIGMGMIFATRKHLHALDELQRKIQLEAMAITLGLAVVVGLAYSLLEQTNLINYNAKISHLVIFIGLTYLVATLIGNYRYK